MNQFILAFPIPAAVDAPFSLSENVCLLPEAKTVMVPGCSVQFNVVRHGPSTGLSEIFREHHEISGEEAAAIDAHQSLLFLLGTLKGAEDLKMVNVAILKLFQAGATGVYMQHSGTAWTPDAFREELADAEFPMDPWINFIENSETLYTLGLEIFGLPDLCMSRTGMTSEELRDILGVVADSIYIDGISSKSGTEVNGGDLGTFTLRAESRNPFPKDAPEYNRQGVMRLLRK